MRAWRRVSHGEDAALPDVDETEPALAAVALSAPVADSTPGPQAAYAPFGAAARSASRAVPDTRTAPLTHPSPDRPVSTAVVKTTLIASTLLLSAALITVPPTEHVSPPPAESVSPAGPTGYCAPPEAVKREIYHELRRASQAQRREVSGAWQRLRDSGIKHVLCFEDQAALHGEPTSAQHQRRGTCVSRAGKEAIENSIAMRAVDGQILTRSDARVCYELLYGGARSEILHGQLGSGDGCFHGALALYAVRHGAIARGVWAGVDLSEEDSQEQLAVQWGAPDGEIPPEIEQAAQAAGQHVHVAAWPLVSAEEIADALASGAGVAIEGTVPGGSRNSEGFATGSTGGHSIAVCGVFLSRSGQLSFLCRQSWGPEGVGGPDRLATESGEIDLPAGYFGYDAERLIGLVRPSLDGGAMAYLALDDAFAPLSSPLELVHAPSPRRPAAPARPVVCRLRLAQTAPASAL
jgi:hypothetical protein